jgi:hypothetical protein
MAFYIAQIFIAKMRKADDGANEHEKDSELGVHFTPLHYISRPHSFFDTTFLSAVIDEDQKHIAEDASLPVRFIPSSANARVSRLSVRTLAA